MRAFETYEDLWIASIGHFGLVIFGVQIPNKACTTDQSQLRRAEGSRSRRTEASKEEEAAGRGWTQRSGIVIYFFVYVLFPS